ncbi:unnamed protein product [Psylliodes chrysocephalus]|uniref:glutathione transferase n=1 Tax=Psylliodes chrysocephalus TaxID=3402493 RepID=A0A9P0GAZ6_9CUCU|nr:unnamed protein product [Psylliodes chrysocephala]
MVLKLYFDLFSQPARSLYIFLKLAKIPFEECRVNLGKGEHLTKEFAETKSKIQKIPFIHHGDFRLNESIGIVRYLSREYSIADHWYPKDSKKQAKVDEFLEWNHLNIRLNCSSYFLVKWLMPLKNGKQPSEEECKNLTRRMEKSLEDFERIFLSNERFLFGNSVSYADVHAACEIEQTRMAGYDVRDHFPKIKTWIESVRSECNPVYDQAHKFVNMMAEGNEKQLNSKL